MEPPAKRSRVGPSPFGEDDYDDELFHEPEQLNASRDPAVQLERSRAVAAFKLKSSWETIFEKYAKDFTGVGDEIDMKTGEVVVDNGHIRSLNDAEDDCRSEAGSVDEEQRILHGTKDLRPGYSNTGAMIPHPLHNARLAGVESFIPGPPRLSTMILPSRHQLSTPLMPFGAAHCPSIAVESAWDAPELPARAFEGLFQSASTATLARRVAVRTLPARKDDEADEDDILLGTSCSQVTSRRSAVNATRQAQPLLPSSGIDNIKPASDGRAEVAAATKSQRSPQQLNEKDPTLSVTSNHRARNRIQVVITQYRKKLHTPSEPVTNGSEEASVSEDGIPIQQQTQPACATDETAQLAVVKVPPLPHLEHAVSELRSRPRRERKEAVRFPSICVPEEKSRNEPHREDLSKSLVLRQDARAERDKRCMREAAPRKMAQVLPVTPPGGDSVPQKNASDEDTEPSSQNPTVSKGSAQASCVVHNSRSPKPLETFSRNTMDPSYTFSDEDEPTASVQGQIGPVTDITNIPSSKARQASLPTKKRKKQLPDSGSTPTLRKSFYALTKNLPSTKAPGAKILQAGKRALKRTLPLNGGASSAHDDSNSNAPNPQKRKEPPSKPQVEELPSPAEESGAAAEIIPGRKDVVGGVAPATPNRVSHQKTPDKRPPSSSKISIMSLVSDGEEDELSLDFISPSFSGSRPVLSNRSRPSPVAASAMRRISAMKRRHQPDPYAKSSPLLARRRFGPAAPVRRPASSPTAMDPDLVRTPGGSLRRCGDGGFQCDRDFCFTCL